MGSNHSEHAVQVQQENDSDTLFWITVKVLMFLVPFLMLLRIVTAMREVRLSRNSANHSTEQSLSAILWVSALPLLRKASLVMFHGKATS